MNTRRMQWATCLASLALAWSCGGSDERAGDQADARDVSGGWLELPSGDLVQDSGVDGTGADVIVDAADIGQDTHVILNDEDDDGVPDIDDEAPSDPNWPGLAPFGFIYAHTSTALYAWRPGSGAPTLVGPFAWPHDGGVHQMTDIAVTKEGVLYGIAFDGLYRCSVVNGACKTLAMMTFEQQFNGLTMVPAGIIDAEHETMVAISLYGGWYEVAIDDDVATLTQLGSYGSLYYSAGDAYSIESVGTFAAVVKENVTGMGTLLIEIDPATGSYIRDVGWVPAEGIWGLAGLGTMVYAFDSGGAIYGGDVDAGSFTLMVPAIEGAEWWGAGVSTRLKGR